MHVLRLLCTLYCCVRIGVAATAAVHVIPQTPRLQTGAVELLRLLYCCVRIAVATINNCCACDPTDP